MPKRFDSNVSSSEETSSSFPHIRTVQPPFSSHHHTTTTSMSTTNTNNSNPHTNYSADEEISQLKERNAKLAAENEMLKSSILLLSTRLSKLSRRHGGDDAQEDGFDFVAPLPSPVPPPTPTSIALPTPPPAPPPPPAINVSLAQPPANYASILLKRHSSRESYNSTPVLRMEEEVQSSQQQVGGNGAAITCRATLKGHESAVYSCKFSPDENSSMLCSTSLDTTVRVWREQQQNAEQYASFCLGAHEQSGTDVHFMSKTTVVSSSMDTTVRAWDIATQKPLCSTPFACEGIPLCLSVLDQNTVAAASSMGALQLFDIRASANAGPIAQARVDAGVSLNALCNGDFGILSGDSKGSLRHWDVRQGLSESEVLDSGVGASAGKRAAAICGMAVGASRFLAIYSHDNCIRLFAKQEGQLKLVQSLRGTGKSKDWPVRVAFSKATSSNGNLLLGAGSLTREAFVFSAMYPPLTTGAAVQQQQQQQTMEEFGLLQKLEGHAGGIYECDFSHDNTALATCSADSTIKIWSSPQ